MQIHSVHDNLITDPVQEESDYQKMYQIQQ